jgi:hypothetical protein
MRSEVWALRWGTEKGLVMLCHIESAFVSIMFLFFIKDNNNFFIWHICRFLGLFDAIACNVDIKSYLLFI